MGKSASTDEERVYVNSPVPLKYLLKIPGLVKNCVCKISNNPKSQHQNNIPRTCLQQCYQVVTENRFGVKMRGRKNYQVPGLGFADFFQKNNVGNMKNIIRLTSQTKERPTATEAKENENGLLRTTTTQTTATTQNELKGPLHVVSLPRTERHPRINTAVDVADRPAINSHSTRRPSALNTDANHSHTRTHARTHARSREPMLAE